MRTNVLFAAAAILCLSAATALSAQEKPFDALLADPDLAAGVHHSYTAMPGPETPAPKGYRPFYVSHYGRHGSRRNIGSSATAAYDYMVKAREAGLLTPLGEALYRDVDVIHEAHVGMVGELTPRGGREHRGIAERLYHRIPQVFKDRHQVNVASSNIPRCLISMANFTASLDDCAPALRFSFVTGDKYKSLVAHGYYEGREISQRGRALQDSLLRARFDPTRFMAAIFTGTPGPEVIDDPQRFIESIYYYGSISQCLDNPADIFGTYFTPEELLIQYQCYNVRTYNNMANSAEFGDRVIWAAKGLAHDIIDKADAAIAGNDVAADLRFGHDSGILPLAGLMGLEGPGERLPALAIDGVWESYERVPMASNLQLIFYRDRRGDVLVKVLYNERETALKAVSPVTGPYYRWSDVKDHLLKECDRLLFDGR